MLRESVIRVVGETSPLWRPGGDSGGALVGFLSPGHSVVQPMVAFISAAAELTNPTNPTNLTNLTKLLRSYTGQAPSREHGTVVSGKVIRVQPFKVMIF